MELLLPAAGIVIRRQGLHPGLNHGFVDYDSAFFIQDRTAVPLRFQETRCDSRCQRNLLRPHVIYNPAPSLRVCRHLFPDIPLPPVISAVRQILIASPRRQVYGRLTFCQTLLHIGAGLFRVQPIRVPVLEHEALLRLPYPDTLRPFPLFLHKWQPFQAGLQLFPVHGILSRRQLAGHGLLEIVHPIDGRVLLQIRPQRVPVIRPDVSGPHIDFPTGAVSIHNRYQRYLRFLLRARQLLVHLFYGFSGTVHPVDPRIHRKIVPVIQSQGQQSPQPQQYAA